MRVSVRVSVITDPLLEEAWDTAHGGRLAPGTERLPATLGAPSALPVPAGSGEATAHSLAFTLSWKFSSGGFSA